MKPRTLLGVWIDSSRAVIVTISGDETSISKIGSEIEGRERIEGESSDAGRFGNQFVDHERTRENRQKGLEADFLGEVIDAVREGDQLLVFGPAQMKQHLEKRIKAESRPMPNLRAVESADSMTDNQIAAYVRDFFGKSSAAPRI